MKAEFNDIMAAWFWAIEHHELDVLNEMLHGLWLYYFLIGRGLRIDLPFKAIHALAKAGTPSPDLARLWQRTAVRWAIATPQGDGSSFIPKPALLEELAALADDPYERALAQLAIGSIHLFAPAAELAMPALRSAESLLQQQGDVLTLAYVLNRIGFAAIVLGNVEEFTDYTERSVGLCVANGLAASKVIPLGNLATSALFQGHYDRARAKLADAIALTQQVTGAGIQFYHMFPWANLMLLHFMLGEFTEAHGIYERVDATVRMQGALTGYSLTLAVYAMLHAASEDYELGAAIARQSLDLADNASVRFSGNFALSMNLFGLNDAGAAAALLAGLRFLKPAGHYLGILLVVLPLAAVVLHRSGQHDLAVQCLAAAQARAPHGHTWFMRWRPTYTLEAALRSALGTTPFDVAWARGRNTEPVAIITDVLTALEEAQL